MSEPWGDNSRPDEGCGFCSDFPRSHDSSVCDGCRHSEGYPEWLAGGGDVDPAYEAARADSCPVCGAPGGGCVTCLAKLRCEP